MVILSVVLCTVALGHLALGQLPLVNTSQGTLRGKVLSSRDGKDYFSFTGIPYAKPPVGPLRFMISERADNWTGLLDATEPAPHCFQPNLTALGPKNIGQEDCLYLNIFTPNIAGNLPVIFNIHGGAFMTGSAAQAGSAENFMDEDVVLVAPNYRLGNLGFLSLEDNVLPGNLGLKDQALALEWVHKEISAFGGNPNLITVIGQSAGGASSNIICEAPRTNGLIKGCVSQSGTAWATWAFKAPGVAREMALNMIKAVGCTENGVLQCLQNKPIEVVGNISLTLIDHKTLSIISPVLERATAPGALITRWPTAANHNFPWIVGICQDDGMLFTAMYEYHFKSKQETEIFINNFMQNIIIELHLENRTNDFQRIKDRFFGEGVGLLRGIRNFLSEYLFVYPAMKALTKHPGPTYFYKFNYTGGPQVFLGDKEPLGVGHGAELPYFFGSTHSLPGWPRPWDVELSKMLVKMWVNFARNQTPSEKGMMVQWPHFQGQYYLDIQNSGVSLRRFTQMQEILDFWKTIIQDQSSKSSTSQSSVFFITALSIFAVYRELFI